MPKTRPAYPAEFRRQMVDLVRAGRNPTDLAREFEPARQTIQNWVAEADRSEGRREAKPPPADLGLTATERDELARLRREVRQLKLERDPEGAPSGVISSLARRPGLRGRPGLCHRGLPVHERQPGRLPHRRHGPHARRIEGRILCLDRSADITYVPTASGFLYLAVVLDAFSRRIVGWAMAHRLRSELVLDALEMAVTQRRPHEVIHHSTKDLNTPRWPSATAAGRRVCAPR